MIKRKVTCLWCGEPLRFEAGRGWIHQNGELYKGNCYCEGVKHEKSRDCPTWRDDHVATPNRSKQREE